MAADYIARGLAAVTRNTARPAFSWLADLSSRTIAPGCDTIEAGSGIAWARYVADPLATPALAATHPLFCGSDASGRSFRYAGDEIDIAHAAGGGAGNLQPGLQAAVDYAAAVGIRRIVNRTGLLTFDMWCPRAVAGPFGANPDGHPLIVRAPIHFDFAGATITLKGPTGNADRNVGQTYVLDTRYPWMGGWLRVLGGDEFNQLIVENVTVKGNWSGDVTNNANANPTDKAIWIQDTHVDHVILRNVNCFNFAGEICYLAGQASTTGTPINYHVEDCKFEGSPQSAFNPNNGRMTAIRVQAGRSYQPMETVCALGYDFYGCRFYDGSAGIYAQGGPDPGYLYGYPYDYPVRRTDLAPPFITFHNTRFENSGPLTLTGWVQGKVYMVDAPVFLTGMGVCDINLDVESWADRSNVDAAVVLGGPANLTTQIPGCPAGVNYEPPTNINVEVHCHRTKKAEADGKKHSVGVRLLAGLYDKDTIRFAISGEATQAWDVINTPPTGFGVPLMDVAPWFRALSPTGISAYDYINSSRSYKPLWHQIAAIASAAGSYTLTLDNTYGYADGQRIRFFYGPGGYAATLTFAKNGAGLMLNADRTMRRTDEFLELRWSSLTSKWQEAGYLDQGV
ncbi:MAG: hypothetical protein ABIT09_09090 [Croceibacterium sp.]